MDREAFENYLQENNAKGDIFIVFGGFYKLPGVGGIGCSCYYEFGSKEQVVKIPYENPMSFPTLKSTLGTSFASPFA